MRQNMRLFLSYVIPSVIAMLVIGSYSIIDSIFIGRAAGPVGLAAVALTWPLVMLFGAVGDMFGTGAAVIISQSRGRGDIAHARKIFGTMMLAQVFGAVILTALFSQLLGPVLNLFGATPELMPIATRYAMIMICGGVASMLVTGMGAVIRNDGRPVLSMIFISMGLITNIILDYVLIFVFDMGVRGAAIATVISQMIGVIAELIYFTTNFTQLRFGRDMIGNNTKHIRDIVINGIPSFGNQIAIIAMLFLHNFQSLRYGGTSGLAIYTFIGAIESIGSLFMTGLALGVQPLVAYLYGGKNYRTQNDIGNLGYIFAALAGVIMMLACVLGRNTFPAWFNLHGQIAEMAAHGLLISSMAFLLLGIIRVAGYYYQATGKIRHANMLIYGDAFVALPLCLFILPVLFGLDGVWMAMPVSRAILFVVVCWLWFGRRIKNKYR